MSEIIGSVTSTGVISGKLEESISIKGTIDTGMADVQQYAGSLVITPSENTQTLNTRGLRMMDNLTINPIPQNYGKITWNGSTLTVS